MKNRFKIAFCLLVVAGLLFSIGGIKSVAANGKMTLLTQTELDNWFAAGTDECSKCETKDCGTDDGSCDDTTSTCDSSNEGYQCHIYKDYSKRLKCKEVDGTTEECNYSAEECYQQKKCTCQSSTCKYYNDYGFANKVDACGTWTE